MAIFRGPGGAGDATADATNAASVAEDFADAAGISAAAAVASANTASSAAAAAGVAQTAAELAETNAETALTSVQGLVASLNTADIATLAPIAADISAVALITADISSVALLSTADLSAIASVTTEIQSLAPAAADITQIAALTTAQLVALSGATADMSALAPITLDITAVASVTTEIQALVSIGTAQIAALSTADLAAVASVSADIQSLGPAAADITQIAALTTAQLAALSGATSDMASLAPIAADISAVAAIDTEVTAVAALSTADISTVATNVADITNFADVYLGPKSSDPATRNDSSALQTGDLYFDTVNDIVKVYDGAAWQAAFASLGGALVAANNLSDLTNVTSAQQNLDLEPGVDVQAYDSNLTSFVSTFTLPTTDGTNGQALTTNGSGTLAFASIAVADIITPTNVSPADEAIDIGETPTLTGSTYYSLYGKVQKSSQWQVSTDVTFATTDYDSNEVLGVGVTHAVPAGNLDPSETYYWRVRYRDVDDAYSEYSTPTEFDTATSFNNFIATPTATPSLGGALEGGFHTGLIWNQVTQSATSTTIGTGSKTFTVTDSAPLFYSGQAVEVRSRANPATARMIGTVTGSTGTTLVVNVASVDGSGTLTDWSVMAKFRVIVAPKSSGESSSKQYKNANTAAPAACGTLTEGLKATVALVADGNSTVYPAAHFCNDLSIGGYSDWYLPARDELELIWRNLKPVTNNNYTVTDRPTGATPDYKNLGSLGDTANTHGLNNNSDPQGVAYTAGSPAQTGVAAFQSGGAEAMTFGSNYYWSSTEYSTTLAWVQNYNTGLPGYQNGDPIKTNSFYVRAVRRSII